MDLHFLDNFFINQTGGLSYHRRAIFYSHLWRHHHSAVNEWLANWPKTSDHLILVGPSFGYSLPREFLSTFARISFFEVDPWVRGFSWLLPKSRGWQGLGPLAPETAQRILKVSSSAQWLFCNLLGQLALGRRFNLEKERWRDLFKHDLALVNWASFHDLWSIQEGPTELGPWQAPRHTSIEDSVQHFFPLASPTKPILDHQTDEFMPKCERRQWIWRITPNQYHCIEGVRSSTQVRGA